MSAPEVRRVPVTAYMRMSTERQQYSTENQLDRIREYATQRGMEIEQWTEERCRLPAADVGDTPPSGGDL